MVYNVGIDEKGGALRMAEYRDRGDRRTGRLEDESNQAGNKDRSRESVRRGNMGSVTRGGQRGNTDRAAGEKIGLGEMEAVAGVSVRDCRGAGWWLVR